MSVYEQLIENLRGKSLVEQAVLTDIALDNLKNNVFPSADYADKPSIADTILKIHKLEEQKHRILLSMRK